jgi:hypothetical protein
MIFKKHMAKLSVTDVQNFQRMMADLKAEFAKCHDEANGSRECLKHYAEKCVQAHNEALKRKALGHPGIDPKLAAKKKPMQAEAEAPRHDRPSIIFPSSMTGSKTKVPSTASEGKKTKQAEAEARKHKHQEASDVAPSKKKMKTKIFKVFKKRSSCTSRASDG